MLIINYIKKLQKSVSSTLFLIQTSCLFRFPQDSIIVFLVFQHFVFSLVDTTWLSSSILLADSFPFFLFLVVHTRFYTYDRCFSKRTCFCTVHIHRHFFLNVLFGRHFNFLATSASVHYIIICCYCFYILLILFMSFRNTIMLIKSCKVSPPQLL